MNLDLSCQRKGETESNGTSIQQEHVAPVVNLGFLSLRVLMDAQWQHSSTYRPTSTATQTQTTTSPSTQREIKQESDMCEEPVRCLIGSGVKSTLRKLPSIPFQI